MLNRLFIGAGAGAYLALLSACSTVAPIDPNNDALRLECHWDLKYPAVAPGDASVEQLREVATRRLAQLRLNAQWTLEQEGVSAEAFTDSLDDRARLQRLLSVVLPGLERYPHEFFANVRLKNIVLVKELAVGGQRRLAMPMAETDGVAYADNNAKTLCPAGMEMRVHHEFYHFIDHREFNDYYHPDPSWLAMNPEGLQYGKGGATFYGKNLQDLGHVREGLVSMYAGYGQEEDKAETFGWMMTPDYAARLDLYALTDPRLAAKVRHMRAQWRRYSAPQLAPSSYKQ
jgi:hypothetical protein